MSRKIEKYPDKALRPILVNIVESLTDDGYDLKDFIEDYEQDFTGVYGIIEYELASYGLDSEFEDITYIVNIFINNLNFMTEPIKRPKLMRYQITHIYDRTVRVQDKYLNTFDSYIPLTKDIMRDLESEGFYEPYNGEEISSDTMDSDWVDDWVDEIRKI